MLLSRCHGSTGLPSSAQKEKKYRPRHAATAAAHALAHRAIPRSIDAECAPFDEPAPPAPGLTLSSFSISKFLTLGSAVELPFAARVQARGRRESYFALRFTMRPHRSNIGRQYRSPPHSYQA